MKLPSARSLTSDYLFGIPLVDGDGNAYPISNIEGWIERSVSWLETQLQIKIAPTTITAEHHDYNISTYSQFCYIQLYQFPVISVEALKASYAGVDVMSFPADWIQIYKESGQLQLMPTNGSLSQVLLGAGSGSLLPLISGRMSNMPHLFKVDYTAGFAANEVPATIADLISMKASIGILNIMGDILLGAGIASQSVSIDGLSESITTTQSAENSSYSARIRQYERQIKAELPELKAFYKGMHLAVG
ncbi:MAG: hypothetical protein JEZ11_24595 [Desulfobacterales bacterium]|nr:hypothetical protein [Desulfobacterales bacterium]